MKKADIYEVAIKILGIYLFFTSLGLLRELLSVLVLMVEINNSPVLFNDSSSFSIFWLSIANFGLVLLFANILTFRTKAIVKLICKPSDYDESATLFAEKVVIYEMAIVIMGLFLIMWTFPDFAFKLRLYIGEVQSNLPIRNNNTQFLIISLIKIGVGAMAVVYSKSISMFIDKKRPKN